MTTPSSDLGSGSHSREPAGHLDLARAVLTREVLVFIRYPVDALGSIVAGVLVFAVLFFGGRAIAGQALTDSIEGLIVGYFLWTLSMAAYSGVSSDLTMELQWGTLERHFVTPFGFAPVIMYKAVAKLAFTFFNSAVLLAAMLLISGTTLELNVVTIVVISTITICSVLGLGFAAGGLTVLYKRIGQWLSFLQFGFIGLISAPAFGLGWAKALPLAQGSALLQRAMIKGTRVWEFPPLELAILLVTGIGYLLLGYLVFHFATRRARRLGVLGDY